MSDSKLKETTLPPVVVLVDDRQRDLGVATLIAHHLRANGVDCMLEPLEAFRAVLAAYRPGMIIFNHMTASHMVAWSRRLADIGVLTAVLPNEGISYDEEALRYNAGRYHSGAHIDYFFCWNEVHKNALRSEGFGGTRVEITGVPRFDFYFQPFANSVRLKERSPSRPKVLFCTNFVTAKYWELPKVHGDRLFSQWAKRVSVFKDYWPAIEAQWKGRQRTLDFLNALVESDKYDVALRPHPRETTDFYERWIDNLSPAACRNVVIDSTSGISDLILSCDIEISCETCTTAIESWIAGKPTIELVLERNPLWYVREHAAANVECDSPDEFVDLVEQQLANPEQPALRDVRRRHLEKWCASPDGRSCERIAAIAAEAVKSKQPADWSKLSGSDYRRAAKLFGLRKLGLAYHFDPLLTLKRRLLGDRYAIKDMSYRKSIKPRDVREAQQRLEKILATSFEAHG